MLSCGVGKVLPGPTVGAKCSYPTWEEIVHGGIDGNRVEDVEPNGILTATKLKTLNQMGVHLQKPLRRSSQ